MVGSKLTHRIRLKAFACLLRQETAYFDQPENSSGAISVRLSSDAASLEQMVGIRLGAICGALAVSCVGFVFGIFFSWELTIIVVVYIFLVIIGSYIETRLRTHSDAQPNFIRQSANVVRFV